MQKQQLRQDNPSFNLTIERLIALSPELLYWAWTEGIDHWLAVPGTVHTNESDRSDIVFNSNFPGKLHSYAIRFLCLIPDQLIVCTLLSAPVKDSGTIISVKLLPNEYGTKLLLFHDGFSSEIIRDGYGEAWIKILERMEDKLVYAWLTNIASFFNNAKAS